MASEFDGLFSTAAPVAASAPPAEDAGRNPLAPPNLATKGETRAAGPASEFDGLFDGAAPKAPPAGGTPPAGQGGTLFGSLLMRESNGQQFDKAGNPLTSSKGAIGIAQVMPATAPEAARLAGLPFDDLKYRTDANYNRALGQAYFDKQLQDFKEPAKALAAYNAGPGAMQRAQSLADKSGTPDQWLKFLPAETQAYVPNILARMGQTGAPAGQAAAPAAQGGYVDTASSVALTPKLGLGATAWEGFKGGAKSSQALGAQVGALILNTAGIQPELQKSLLAYAEGKSKEVAGATGEVASFSDAIGPNGDLPRWVANSAGYLGYQIGESILTGGLGALVGKTIGKTAVTTLAKGMVEKEIGTLAASTAARGLSQEQIGALAASHVASKLGAVTSIFANNMRQEGGSIYGDAVEQSGKTGQPVDIGRVWASALAASGVDTAADVFMAKGLLGMKEGSTAATYAGRVAREIPKNMAVQGGTEAVQTGIEQWGADKPLDTRDIVDSAAVGALGGVAGGAGVAMHRRMPAVADPLAAIEQQRQAELAPVAAAAAQGGALSKAALAGNASPAAAAEYAAQHLQGQAQQQAAQASEQAAADAAHPPASQAPVDPLAARVQAVLAQAHAGGVLDALRAENSPIDAKQFVNDLAIAQSPSTRADLREQALSRLEYAAAWAETSPVATVASGIEQNVGEAQEGLQAAATPAPAVATLAPVNHQAETLLRRTDLTDVDRQTLTAGLDASTNPALPEATRHAARTAVNEVIGRNTAPVATAPLAPGARTPSLFAPQAAPAGSPEEVLTKARQNEDSASQLEAMGYPDEAATHADQADLMREEAKVRQAASTAPAATPAAPAETAANVAAPRVAIPAGEGSAQLRKRRAVLAKVISDGLNKVERRNDGSFYLVDGTRKRQFKLDGPADAQLARKAVTDAIHTAASQANTAPTEAQAEAGNYKKGRVEFDGLKLGIENPVGSTRSGKAPDGTPWSVTMSAHYGDLTGTTGADGDGVDVYLVANPRHGSPAFVVDQYDGSKFDEHKVILGVASQAEAVAIYDAHFSDGSGPLRRGAVTAMTISEFKAWAESPAAQQPAGARDGRTGSNPERGPAQRAADTAPDIAAGVVAGEYEDRDANGEGRDHGRTDRSTAGAAAADGRSAAAGHVSIRVDGRQRRVELVNPQAANDGSPKRHDGADSAGSAGQISPANSAVMDAIGKLFGKQVQFFRDSQLGDGFVDPARPNSIFLNEKSSISPLAVFSHEFWHQVEAEMPEVHAAVMKVVSDNLGPDAAHRFRNDYYRADAGPNPNGALTTPELREITSDIGGNLMTDGGFWKEVFAQVEAQSPGKSKGLIAEFAAYLNRLIDQLLASIRQPNFRSTELVGDLEKVRAAFKDGLARYINANGIGKASIQAAILKATQGAKKADVAQSSKRDYNPGDEAATQSKVANAGNDSAGGLGRGTGALSNAIPEYGQARPGAVSVIGRHYSDQPRQALNGAAFGRGLKGAERDRVNEGDDARLRKRIYFYVDKGQGIRPESGVGGYAHEVKLNNLYDPRSRLIPAQKNSNAFEGAVLDAGFDGYVVPDFTTTQGAAVLLGGQHQAVPVRAIGQPASAPLPAAAAPSTESRGLMSKELNAIETGNIPGAQLRHGTLTIPLDSREAANDEMARIGSGVRFSAARESDAPAAQYAAIEAQYKGTPQWLKAPDGQATQLTERQWVHVRTPAFKAWFGDWEKAHAEGGVWSDDQGAVSKAVGLDGEPLVVYHGTDDGGFTEFRKPGGTRRGDLGLFTTPNEEMARSYVRKGHGSRIDLGEKTQAELEAMNFEFFETDEGKVELIGADGNVIDSGLGSMAEAVALANLRQDNFKRSGIYAAFLNLRQPNEADFEGANFDGSRNEQWVIEDEGGEQLYAPDGRAFFSEEQLAKELDRLDEADISAKARQADDHYESTDSVVREARQFKNDGAIIRSVMDDGGGRSRYSGEPSDVFVVFEPNQLKSADFNNGSYGVNNNDISFSQKRDPAIGDRTDVARLPKGRPIPESVAVGSLEQSLALARAKTYTRGRQLKQDLQARVLAAAKEARVNLAARTKETFKFLVGMVKADARLALKSNANAIGWYDKTVSRAIGALATVHPEIETDPKARLAFLWALATTSNGLRVDKNFELAESAYRQWKDSGSMPADVGIGNAAGAINKGLALFNTLSAKMGHERLFKFMATEFQVGQIGRMLGEQPGGEWMPTPVLGSAVLGPKIGNGFFSNLNGYFSALTMDRWLMRGWGRLTGTLIDVDPAKVNTARAALQKAIAGLSAPERTFMAKLIGSPLRKSLTRAELDELATAISKTSMKPEKRALMTETPATDALRLSGNALQIVLDGQKEAPTGPAERNWIRAVYAQTLAELNQDRSQDAQDMTMSDLQALLWYPERRLYDAAKSNEEVADGYEDDEAPDYANAARTLALANGISSEKIEAAMDRAELRGTVKGKRLDETEKSAMLKEFRAPPAQAVQLAFEVAPDPANTALVAQWGALTVKQRAAITAQVKDAIVDEVVDALGVKVGKTVGATGGYAGLVNPNLITEYKHTQVSMEEARALAAALGLALDQDSVALVDPRAEYGAGLIRISFNGKAEPHAATIFAALRSATPEVDAFTARGNNFDVLNFTSMTNEELHDKMQEVVEGLGLPLDGTISFGDIKSELVEKADYDNHIQGLRPGAGQEIHGRIEGLRDRARAIVAKEIGSTGQAGLDRGARPGARRAAAARRNDGSASATAGAADAQPVQDPGGIRRSPGRVDRAGGPDQGCGIL